MLGQQPGALEEGGVCSCLRGEHSCSGAPAHSRCFCLMWLRFPPVRGAEGRAGGAALHHHHHHHRHVTWPALTSPISALNRKGKNRPACLIKLAVSGRNDAGCVVLRGDRAARKKQHGRQVDDRLTASTRSRRFFLFFFCSGGVYERGA